MGLEATLLLVLEERKVKREKKKKVLPIILSFPKSTRLSVAKQISEVIDQNVDHNVPFLLDLVLKCINRPNY